MPLIEDPMVKLMSQVLGFTNLRQDVISSNIANANTPGYKAFDVVLEQTMGGGKSLAPRTSNARHMVMSLNDTSAAKVQRSNEPARLDGNNVNLDVQLMKLMENRTMYQVAMELKDRWHALKPYARDVR